MSIDDANGHFYLKTKVKNEIKKNEIKKNEKKSEKNRGQLGRPEMWQVEDIYFCWSFSAQSPFSLGMTFHLCIWSLQVTYLSSSGILWSWTRVSWVRPKFWLRFCGYALVRPFMYLDPPTLLRPKPYFDFFGQTLLRPKLYFDLCFSTNKKPRFDKRSKYRSRSKEFEVKRTKYRKGRRYDNGRSTEKVKLMRTPYNSWLDELSQISLIFSQISPTVSNISLKFGEKNRQNLPKNSGLMIRTRL